jgi:hypothetical protein
VTRAVGVFAAALALSGGVAGCRDLSSFTTGSGSSYEGPVVSADFVRAGIDQNARLCLTMDTDHLQDAPGALSTSDGRFHAVPMRTIPQIWQDPLSTLSFGEGRLKNLVYVAAASTPFSDANGNDVYVIVSLMQSGDIEVRLIRGAPGNVTTGAPSTTGGNLFAVFDLSRQSVPCSY